MPETVLDLDEAAADFEAVVERAAAGESLVIAKDGRPLVRLVPYESRKPERVPGLLKGKVWIADDFDDPLPDDMLKAFYGDDDDATPSKTDEPGGSSKS